MEKNMKEYNRIEHNGSEYYRIAWNITEQNRNQSE